MTDLVDLAPARSRTDPPAPEQQRSQRLRRRLHANTLGQIGGNNQIKGSNLHSHHHRHGAKDAIQSATELKPPISFDNLLRREKKGAEPNSKEIASAAVDDSPVTQPLETMKRVARPEDVAKAKRDNARREEELRASLKSVEEIGMDSTRQLDHTYYAILEKAAILRSTVASLQQLADESRKMHTSFQEETTGMERDTTQNVQGFGNFDEQEKTINELVSRLHTSRTKTDQLNDRLETARLRVEAYEERDNAKQAKRKAQWRVALLSILGVVVLIIAILVARDRERVGEAVEQQLLRIGDLVDDVAAPRSRPSPSEDPYLQKLFEKL